MLKGAFLAKKPKPPHDSAKNNEDKGLTTARSTSSNLGAINEKFNMVGKGAISIKKLSSGEVIIRLTGMGQVNQNGHGK
jgi:hypothetical protein